MNIEVCLKLGHKKLVARAAGQTRDQMFPTLCFFVSPTCAEYAAILFFSIAFFV